VTIGPVMRPTMRPTLSLSLTRAGVPAFILLTQEGQPILTEESLTIQPEPANA